MLKMCNKDDLFFTKMLLLLEENIHTCRKKGLHTVCNAKDVFSYNKMFYSIKI